MRSACVSLLGGMWERGRGGRALLDVRLTKYCDGIVDDFTGRAHVGTSTKPKQWRITLKLGSLGSTEMTTHLLTEQ